MPHAVGSRSSRTHEDTSIDAVVELWRDRGAKILSLMHVGADGWLKSLDFAPVDEDHLRSILRTGERADGSSLFAGGGLDTQRSDMLLRPRPDRAFLDPFSDIPTVIVLCRHEDRDGLPLAQSPDTLVRKAQENLAIETNCELWAHGEVEFFLGKPSNDHDMYGADDCGYHAASPFVFGESIRRRAIVVLRDIGVPVKYAHSEVGYIEAEADGGIIWEQHEIELGLLPLADAADAIVLTQWVVRSLAHRQNMRCSTEPILVVGHPGNGLHIHLSPRRDGTPLEIQTDQGELTDAGTWLIGGLVRVGAALMAFGNRSPHSFTRLQQGREVPHAVRWGTSDRSALVRIPIVPRDGAGRPGVVPTVEFRLPDGSAHPHLLLAGIAQAMAEGRKTPDRELLLRRTQANSGAGGSTDSHLPTSNADISDAVEQWRYVLQAGDVFPAPFLDTVIHRLRR